MSEREFLTDFPPPSASALAVCHFGCNVPSDKIALLHNYHNHNNIGVCVCLYSLMYFTPFIMFCFCTRITPTNIENILTACLLSSLSRRRAKLISYGFFLLIKKCTNITTIVVACVFVCVSVSVCVFMYVCLCVCLLMS